VFAENDAINALTAARIFRPDLILLDVIMPGMDGGEVAARLRKDPLLRNTPVIFLTGIISNEETDGHEMVSGGETFLAKPVDIDELKKTLEDHMPRCIAHETTHALRIHLPMPERGIAPAIRFPIAIKLPTLHPKASVPEAHPRGG